MQARAVAKNIRMSARKMRLVIDEIRGESVNDAYGVPIQKCLKSAVSNAVYQADEEGEVLDADELRVKEAFVDEGPTMKRWRPRAFGRATPIRKRTSHVTIVVDTKE
ncbi:MAG: 50S ribosomal protein L22 [Gemmatimonadota bacterium]